MGVLDNLFTGTPATTNGNTQSETTMPAWYQDMMRGIAAQGVNQAATPYQQYQGQRVAGWAPEHATALNRINANAGAWDAPIAAGINAMSALPGQVAGTYQAAADAAGNAVNAVGGPAQNWTDNWQKYMSPYTSAVVDNIGRLGARNLSENLLPAVNNAFVGAGGFGSTRNAEIMARTMRDTNQDILGQQSNALQSGYQTGANIFGADANRAQQQGQLQAQTQLQGANTALQAAQGWGNTVNTAAQGMGALSQMGQGIQANDTNALIMAGDRQQQQQQKQLDAQYQDFTNYNDWGWKQLGALSGLMRGVQIPTATTQTSFQGGTAAQPSGLQWLSMLGTMFGNQPAATTTPK